MYFISRMILTMIMAVMAMALNIDIGFGAYYVDPRTHGCRITLYEGAVKTTRDWKLQSTDTYKKFVYGGNSFRNDAVSSYVYECGHGYDCTFRLCANDDCSSSNNGYVITKTCTESEELSGSLQNSNYNDKLSAVEVYANRIQRPPSHICTTQLCSTKQKTCTVLYNDGSFLHGFGASSVFYNDNDIDYVNVSAAWGYQCIVRLYANLPDIHNGEDWNEYIINEGTTRKLTYETKADNSFDYKYNTYTVWTKDYSKFKYVFVSHKEKINTLVTRATLGISNVASILAEASGKHFWIRCASNSNIRIIGAIYGGNCANIPIYDHHLSQACNGKNVCGYTINYSVIGDPCFKVPKDYFYSFVCERSMFVAK